MLSIVSRRAGALLAVIVSFAVVACAPTPGPRYAPVMDFSDLERLRIDVSRVEIVQDYRAPLAPPNVDHLFPVSPTAAIERWVDRRFDPRGQEGNLRIIIRDASVVEEELGRTGGVRGFFTRDQAERYSGAIEVRIEATKPRRDAFTDLRVTRVISVAEDISLADREKRWFDMTESMVREIDRGAAQWFQRDFQPFILPGG